MGSISFGYSTNGLPYNLRQAIRAIYRTGYEHIELLADYPHIDPSLFTEGDAESSKCIPSLVPIGVTARVSAINGFTALCAFKDYSPQQIDSLTQEEKEHGPYFLHEKGLAHPSAILRLNHIKHCIHLAHHIHQLGGAAETNSAPGVTLNAGRLPHERTTADYWETIVSGYNLILKLAAQMQVRIFVEFEPGYAIDTPACVLKLYQEVDDSLRPWFETCYDIGHAYVALGSEEAIRDNILEFYETIGIGQFHIEDISKNEIGAPRHIHRVPFEGDIHFLPIIKTIADLDTKSHITCELYPYARSCPDWAMKTAYQRLSPLIEMATA